MDYPETYLIKFIADYVRPIRPELESPLLEAIRSLDLGTPLPATVLNSVVDAASSDHSGVSEIGTTVLGELAERDMHALDAIQQMAISKKMQVRHNAIICLTPKIPLESSLTLIRNALLDKSVKVRRKAVDWAGRLQLKAILPDLSKAELIERDQKTRDIISQEVRLLRDGYFTEPVGENATSVTVRTPGSRVCQIFQNRILESRGIDSIISELSGGKLGSSS